MLPRRLRPVLAGALSLLAFPGLASAAEPGITPLNVSGQGVDEPVAIDAALKNARGSSWVRIFADWKQVHEARNGELANMDRRIDRFRAGGHKVIVTFQEPPAGVDMNTDGGRAAYARFMADMASHFKDRVDVWELWNEPDGTFWSGGQPASPAAYADMLKRTYPAIKAVDPDVTIIIGGLVGNNFEFVEGVYDNGAGQFFDGVGIHLDTACRIDPPGAVYREPSGRIGRYAFTGYREVYAELAEHGDGHKQLWMTEIGWNDQPKEGSCDEGVNAGKRPKGVTEAEQAEFLKAAYACFAADPYVRMASWFTLQDREESSRFGLYRHDGTQRQAFTALQEVGNGTGAGSDPGCGARVDRDKPVVSSISAPSLYFHRFVTSGTATDPTTSVRKIELWADGDRIMSQDGGTFSYDWFGASKLAYGEHTVQLRAYDEADNVGIAETKVTRGNPKTSPRTVKAALGIKVKKKGRKLKVTATVKPPADGSFAEQPRGRLELRFERRTAGKWKRSRVRKGIGDGGVHYTYRTYKPGKWRVYGTLVADAPYKRTSTKKKTFRVR